MDMTPTILSVSPTIGQAGTIITIIGMKFYPTAMGNKVTIGGVICTILEANETFIIWAFLLAMQLLNTH